MENLLLQLCKYPFIEKDKEVLSDLICMINDWNQFLQAINDHGIIALAAYNIEQAGLNNLIPAEVIATLKNGLFKNMARNTWLTNNWKEVNAALSSEEIKHILLKGMALEYTLYGGQGLRQMNDNDILVRKEEALRAWNILQQNGFQPVGMLKSGLHRKLLTEIGYHLPPLIKESYVIEIHHRLFKSHDVNFSMPKVFNDAIKIEIQGVEAYVLPEDLHLRFLKDHLIKHLNIGEFQLRMLNDIRLITHERMERIPLSISDSLRKNIYNKKKAYRELFYLVAPKYRLLFILMDLFPSVQWMRKRHNCNTFLAIFHYPRRFGKLFWLLG